MTSKVEMVGKILTLEVEGAKTEETDAEWIVTFNGSQNKYYVSKKDGRISETTTVWWTLTEEEENAIFTDDNKLGNGNAYAIGSGEGFSVITGIKENLDLILITGNQTLYLFIITDEGMSNFQDVSGLDEKQKWYYSTVDDGYDSVKPYNGACPFSIEDCEKITSETFLRRMIDSF